VCWWTKEQLIDRRVDLHAKVEPTGIDLSADVVGIHDSYGSASISNMRKLVAFEGLDFLVVTTGEVLAGTV